MSIVARLLSIFCILSWRVFWLTMLGRTNPEAPPNEAFSDTEIEVLDRVIRKNPSAPKETITVVTYLTKVARLGGYLARSSDGPPGFTVLLRGMAKLIDITFGYALAQKDVGN